MPTVVDETTPSRSSSKRSLGCIFASPGKNLRGLKSLVYSQGEEIINDVELAQRKAEESAWRRCQAAEWLRRMDQSAFASLPEEPTEEEFCLALRNGLILCNVLNKVNPGSVLKVVESPIITVRSPDGPAQSAIQYFENTRNFITAVGDMKLLTFEAADLEKGGSSGKVVDCILCLKGYYEWKQAGGIGVWRYGGTVRITSLPKRLSSLSLDGTESFDELVDESDSSQYEQLMDFLHLSRDVLPEESKAANVLSYLFDQVGIRLLQAYIAENDITEDFHLNSMIIDAVLRKVIQDFSALLSSQVTKLGMFLKNILKADNLSKSAFFEAMARYLCQRGLLVSNDVSRLCICGGKIQPDQHCGTSRNFGLHQRKLEELKSHYHETRQEVLQMHAGWVDELQNLEHHMKGLALAASSYHKVLQENRSLYNQVQDLKGSIRVFCRVRPFLGGQGNKLSTVDHIGENGSLMVVNPNKQGKDARRVFSFNKVFGTNVTQEEIYADTQPLIRSVLDGYNVCIFAYGQTGSGKTYTMSGPDLSNEATWGVNYRALCDLFQFSKARMDIIEYDVRVQMIEIYNEQVRDLLVSDGSHRRLEIRNNSQLNGLNVPDASLVPVKCTKDVLDLMKIGQRNRAVGATALNERSSRSHSILTIHMHGKELVSGTILKGCLHLVDMAGSERVDKSEVVGDRLKEAQHINKSLSALGDVISALGQKSSHVPYRNSKLTQVLQDSLGGQAKTLMFVHINPEANAIGETISTLKFAERVASVELGAARSNKETGDIRELKEEISNMKKAMEKKEAELQQLKAGTNYRVIEGQKGRTTSPYRMPQCGATASVKDDSCQRSVDDVKSNEEPITRSCSSGKQRRPLLPTAFVDKDNMPKLHFVAEEKLGRSMTATSPPPPIRRSISTDRGAHHRVRTKPDLMEDQPIVKFPFSERAPLTKYVATLPAIPAVDYRIRGSISQGNPDCTSDTSCGHQGQNHNKVHPSNQEEQCKQAKQGGTRKNKPFNNRKVHHQVQTCLQMSQMPTASTLDAVSGRTKESCKYTTSEFQDDISHFRLPENVTARGKKIPLNFPDNVQSAEPRVVHHKVDSLLPAKHIDKLHEMASSTTHVRNAPAPRPELKRSRSSPRGKILM